MRRSTPLSLLALAALLLTGCGPQKNATYDDALDLREEIVDAGVECRSDEQQQATNEFEGSTVVECDDGFLIVVTATEGQLTGLMEDLNEFPGGAVLNAANWMILSADEVPLRQLQEDLGGRVTPM